MAADHDAFKRRLQHKYDTERPDFRFHLLDMKAPVKGRGVSYTFVHNDPFVSPCGKMYVNVTHIFPESYGVISLTFVDFEDYSRDGKSDYDTMLSTFVME